MAIFSHEPAPSPSSSLELQPSDKDNNDQPPTYESIENDAPTEWALFRTPSASTDPRSLTLDNDAFFRFVSDLPFKLRFTTIAYPSWARAPNEPLHYHPIPLAPMPGMPQIPEQEAYEFIHLTSGDYVRMVVDETLVKYDYGDLCYVDVVCLYLGFTHRNGQRVRVRAQVDNVGLVTMTWARDVFGERLHRLPAYCGCEGCRESGGGLGHGLEVEVVFPQGVDRHSRWTKSVEQTFGRKKKLPFRSGGVGVKERVAKKVRF